MFSEGERNIAAFAPTKAVGDSPGSGLRFVKNRKPEPVSSTIVNLHKSLCAMGGFLRIAQKILYDFMKAIDFFTRLRYNVFLNWQLPGKEET